MASNKIEVLRKRKEVILLVAVRKESKHSMKKVN